MNLKRHYVFAVIDKINMTMLDMPHVVGLAHSIGSNGTGDFKVVLPSGNVCPFEDHGIPQPPTHLHGAIEVGGILHLCGGSLNGHKGRSILPSSKYVVQPQNIPVN